MAVIRLLFVLTSTVRGGVEEVVLSLVTRLDRTHFRVALAAPATLLRALDGELRSAPVETFAVGASSWFNLAEVATLKAVIRGFRPDIVNPHLFRSTLVAAPLAKWLGVPRVVETYHGREAWRHGLIKGSFAVDRTIARFVDRFIAVSESARDFLVRVKGIPAAKVVVVPNGRDLSLFQPGTGREAVRRELGLDAATPVIGVVGRLEPQKGHRYLLEAFPGVLAEFPDARLLIVGDGSLRADLESRAARLGVAPRVVFAGYRSDIAPLFDAMDVVALPSLYEGMPLTAIEASAMAKPVVATRVDGTPEVVKDGCTGRLVPSGDPMALREAVLFLLRDPCRARAMGRSGRKEVLTQFDLRTQVEATAQAYRSSVIGP